MNIFVIFRVAAPEKIQRKHFIEAGCLEDKSVFDENLKRTVKAISMRAFDKDTRRGTK
jgi:hypothetical protein